MLLPTGEVTQTDTNNFRSPSNPNLLSDPANIHQNLESQSKLQTNCEPLIFIEIDPVTYTRIYDNLCIARKNLENLAESITAQLSSPEAISSKEFTEKLHYLYFLTTNLLISDIGSLFPTSNAIIPSLQNFLVKEIDPILQQFSTKIMTITVMLSKCFSLISFNLPNNETIEKPRLLNFNQSTSEFNNNFSHLRPRTQSLPSTFFQKIFTSPQLKNLSDGTFSADSCSYQDICKERDEIDSIKTSEDDELVLCRICEEYIKISEIVEHSKNCAVAYESSYMLITTDEKIVKLINAIQTNLLNVAWPGESEETKNVVLPMLHVIILLDAALCENQNQIETASRSLDQINFANSSMHNKVALLERAKELLHEKVHAFSHYSQLAKDGLLTLDKMTVQTTIADFEFIKPISSGAYARVFLARKKKTQDIYAIKVTPKSLLKQKNQVQRVLIEKNILLTNNNPFIVNFCMYIFSYFFF